MRIKRNKQKTRNKQVPNQTKPNQTYHPNDPNTSYPNPQPAVVVDCGVFGACEIFKSACRTRCGYCSVNDAQPAFDSNTKPCDHIDTNPKSPPAAPGGRAQLTPWGCNPHPRLISV